MTRQEAIGVLMLSPFYFAMSPVDRKKLVEEYCDLFNKIKILHKDADINQE